MVDGGLVVAFITGVAFGSAKEAVYAARENGEVVTAKKIGTAVFREPLAICEMAGQAYSAISSRLVSQFTGEKEEKKEVTEELDLSELKAMVASALANKGKKRQEEVIDI